MAADYANRPIIPSNFASDIPPPTVHIEITPAQPPRPPQPDDDDIPSYLPPRVSSFNKPPPLIHSPEKVVNTEDADADAVARHAVVAQTAIRGYLARKEYKEFYEQNRWRIEAPKVTTARLTTPSKDKAKRKSRPASRGFRVESLQQHEPDPEPSGIDDFDEAIDQLEKPRSVRKSYAPGMLAPGMGMGMGDFNPAQVKLKAAPRPVSMDMKLAAQSPPLKPLPQSSLKPTPQITTNTAQTKSMPDMPAMPKLKSVGKSPLGQPADGTQEAPAVLAVPDAVPAKRASPMVPKKPGPKMVLPADWEMHVDIQGRKYYHNNVTQETQWKQPDLVPEQAQVKKIKSPVIQHHSQNNLFGNLEALIPAHKFAPQVPKKPPPPPTTGTPPPPEHSPLPATPLSPDTPPLIPVPPLALDSHSSSSATTKSTTTTNNNNPTFQVVETNPSSSSSSSSSALPAASGTSIPASASASSLQHNASSQNLERTPSDQQRDKRSALRKLLDAFLRRRPAKDELVKKNILPEEKDAKEKKKLEKERKKREKEEKKKGKK